MPQHVNAQSFVPGDPRARAAGRKGGRIRKHKAFSADYTLGYQAGARNARRHIRRWIQETQMAVFEKSSDSPFLKAASRLHGDQRAARTPDERHAADEALAHLFRMAGAGRFEEWQASHDTNHDDSMAANPEDATW